MAQGLGSDGTVLKYIQHLGSKFLPLQCLPVPRTALGIYTQGLARISSSLEYNVNHLRVFGRA